MNQYLLDTNALSEASKPRPDKGFVSWLRVANDETLYTSCISLGEIKKGISLVVDDIKNKTLSGWLTKIISDFDGRVIEVDLEITLLWGELVATGQKNGKTVPAIDALIAAQCIQNKLILVTRNIKDFEQFKELSVLCPWTSPSN